MNTNNKNKLPSRESETRTKRERPKVWTPPSQLDAPPAPEGFKHRWLRAETIGQMDQKNVSARMREGWEFVRADEYPDTDWPTIDTGRYSGVIAVGGLMLARIPNEIVKQRQAYFAKLTQDKDDAIANDVLRDQHPSMPISKERSSRVTFGGNKN
tara:strand:+ start:187 stop:651 length:465 start_codon:yes stop_codon:yes gene_type:complete